MFWFFCLLEIFLIGLAVLSLFFILSKKIMSDAQKLSPFECGFNSSLSSMNTFSSHFFIVALIFLVFDIELVMLFPFFMGNEFNSYYSMMTLLVFIIILTLGFIVEWNQKYLDWVK